MLDEVRTHIKRLPGWWLASAIAFAMIAELAPQQMGVLLYKILQVTVGVGIGYLADHALFKYVQVHDVDRDLFGAARIIARALIVVGVLAAISLGI